MLRDFLDQVDIDQLVDNKKLSISQLANNLAIFDGEEDPDFDRYDLALIGIPIDYENAIDDNCVTAPMAIRREFFQLFNWEPSLRLIDLGDVRMGESPMDTYHALAEVLKECISANVLPIILGSTHDFAFGQYLGHSDASKPVNVVTIDERVDLKQPDEQTDSQSYLFNLLAHQPNFLGEYRQIAYQNYLVDPMTVDTMKKMNFDCHRLGHIRADIRRLEPLVRDAQMVSFDMSAMRFADFPGQRFASPNGFLAEEACRAARYAGISDQVQSFGIYEYFPSRDAQSVSAQLVAQMIWHFIEGFYSRKGEQPYLMTRDYLIYTVELNAEGHKIDFVRSCKSDRWWMKVPIADAENARPYRLIPCTEAEYQEAVDQEIPDRWINSFLKYSAQTLKSEENK